jgi:hypothetical protein
VLVLPAGVTSIPATFRPLTVDPAERVEYPGDVEILDGTALAVSAGAYGPFVSTPRRVIVCGGGSVTLPSSTAIGTWVIGQGAGMLARFADCSPWAFVSHGFLLRTTQDLLPRKDRGRKAHRR